MSKRGGWLAGALLVCAVSGAPDLPIETVCQGPGCPNTGSALRGWVVQAPTAPFCAAWIVDQDAPACVQQNSSCMFLGGIFIDPNRTDWLYNGCEVPGAGGFCQEELLPGRILYVAWE